MTNNPETLAQDVAAAVTAAPDTHAAETQAVALLKAAMPHYTWVGIYLLEGTELVLGPYLGKPSPHTRIPLNRGICGAAASQKATIVVPIMRGDAVLGEIDIDSDRPAAFGLADRALLEDVARALAFRLSPG